MFVFRCDLYDLVSSMVLPLISKVKMKIYFHIFFRYKPFPHFFFNRENAIFCIFASANEEPHFLLNFGEGE